jgi:elongation factor Ts
MSTIELVKEVRDRSNVSLHECKLALEEAGGDVDIALQIIKKKGLAKATSREGRIATEGRIHSYLHDGRIGVLLEVNCETDFVTRSDAFKEFCELVSMQIAAMNPEYVREADIPESVNSFQKELFETQLRADNKPEKSWEKIVPGKFNKWHSEVCLMNQDSIEMPGKTLEMIRAELVSKIGENIQVRRFVRWEVGQGLAKAEKKDYVKEVEALAGVSAKG